MRKKRYDIVVVGCGPGGAIAGKVAAQNGAETLIVEERRVPGFPVYDSMSIIYSRAEMEEITGQKVEPAAIYAKCSGLAYVAPSGKRGKPQALPDGIFVNRQLFEKSLAIAAARAGAQIMLHTRVVNLVKEGGAVTGVVIRDGSQLTTIPCSVVIAADGAFQHIPRMAGFELKRGRTSASFGCELVGVKCLKRMHHIDEIHLDETGAGAYRYVVPYTKDRFSVGSGIGRMAARQKKSLKQGFAEFLEHLRVTGQYDFTNASPVNMMSGGAGPAKPARMAMDGIMLIGNAAGGPMWGSRWAGRGVMLGAAYTGRVAAGVAAKAIKKGNVSGNALNDPYVAIIEASKKGQGATLEEATQLWVEPYLLPPEKMEKIVAEIGEEVAALHFYCRGALHLKPCFEVVRDWLSKNK